MLVKSELTKLGLHYIYVELGEAEIMEEITSEQVAHLGNALIKDGLELMDDKKSILVERIKTSIIGFIFLLSLVNKNITTQLKRQKNHIFEF
jgi:hypothetical protein